MTHRPSILADVLDVYAAWDRAIERDRAAGPEGFACPADCCRCCERSPAVPVTAPEAAVAARAVSELPDPLRATLTSRIHQLAALVETDASPHSHPPHGIDGPCPLLENGRCAIYAARPLFCRAYGFAADDDNSYFGCEILYPALAVMQEVRLTSLAAGRAALPTAPVLDASGRQLPECGMLAELVDRLLDSPAS